MNTETADTIGRSIARFCQEVGISRPTFYRLKDKHPTRIEIAKVGARAIVLTNPRDFLEGFRQQAA